MIWTALVLGFLGSFHCVGMCGPIALAVGGSSSNKLLFNKILYNLGRSFTYAGLGLIVGGLGFSLAMVGIQQGVSVAMGILVVFISLGYKKVDQLLTIRALSGVVSWVKSRLFQFLKAGSKTAFLQQV